ncbi:MAG TPA: hypothetical protein VLD65_11665 [Anaerolineales bacterium]|nr:hypothetical protein [Anaerolineales bacterium]
MVTNSQRLTGTQLCRSMLLFFGAFLFAFLLNSYLIHEAGHAFGGVLFGCQFERLNVNPFGTGGWSNQCPESLTQAGKFMQGVGGEIFGLPISIAVTLLLWRKRRPILLPLLMSAAVICIGNLLSVLDSMSSYPNLVFDYGLAIQAGIPAFILAIIAIASLVFGIILMDLLLPLTGIGITTPFWQVLILSLSTWPLYMVIRAIYQSMNGRNIAGPMSLVIFGLVIAILTALCFKPVIRLTDRITHTEPVLPSLSAAWLSSGLGVGLTVILVLSNNL